MDCPLLSESLNQVKVDLTGQFSQKICSFEIQQTNILYFYVYLIFNSYKGLNHVTSLFTIRFFN